MGALEEYTNKKLASYDEAYKSITQAEWVLAGTDSHLLLRSPDSSNMVTEFVVGKFGTLIVHGDGPDIIVRNYRTTSMTAYLSYVAKNNMSYLSTKVVGDGTKFDPDVAIAQLGEEVLMYEEDLKNAPDDGVEECASLVKKVLDAFESSHQTETELYLAMQDESWDAYDSKYGRVPTDDLCGAKAACKRALQLLGIH